MEHTVMQRTYENVYFLLKIWEGIWKGIANFKWSNKWYFFAIIKGF